MRTRGDLVSVLAVLAVPLGLAAVFPREAIGFSAADERPRGRESSVSIVFLDSSSFARAMRSTRILAKHEGGGGVADANLLPSELPGANMAPMIPMDVHGRPKEPAVVECGVPPFLPSRRAPAPVRIAGGGDEDALPFPRSELLKLN